jgi:hypothetical protein
MRYEEGGATNCLNMQVTSRCGLGGGQMIVVLLFPVTPAPVVLLLPVIPAPVLLLLPVGSAAVLLLLPVAPAAVLLPLPVILLTKRFSPVMRLDPKPAELMVPLVSGRCPATWTAIRRARKATTWCDVISATDSPVSRSCC